MSTYRNKYKVLKYLAKVRAVGAPFLTAGSETAFKPQFHVGDALLYKGILYVVIDITRDERMTVTDGEKTQHFNLREPGTYTDARKTESPVKDRVDVLTKFFSLKYQEYYNRWFAKAQLDHIPEGEYKRALIDIQHQLLDKINRVHDIVMQKERLDHAILLLKVDIHKAQGKTKESLRVQLKPKEEEYSQIIDTLVQSLGSSLSDPGQAIW